VHEPLLGQQNSKTRRNARRLHNCRYNKANEHGKIRRAALTEKFKNRGVITQRRQRRRKQVERKEDEAEVEQYLTENARTMRNEAKHRPHREPPKAVLREPAHETRERFAERSSDFLAETMQPVQKQDDC
jgi:hypothetical protein